MFFETSYCTGRVPRNPLDKEEKAEVREERAERRDRQGGRRGWTRYCRCQDAGCVSSRTTGEKYCDDGIRLYFIPLFPPLLWIFSSLLEPFSFREKLTFLETYAYVETRTGSSPLRNCLRSRSCR